MHARIGRLSVIVGRALARGRTRRCCPAVICYCAGPASVKQATILQMEDLGTILVIILVQIANKRGLPLPVLPVTWASRTGKLERRIVLAA